MISRKDYTAYCSCLRQAQATILGIFIFGNRLVMVYFVHYKGTIEITSSGISYLRTHSFLIIVIFPGL